MVRRTQTGPWQWKGGAISSSTGAEVFARYDAAMRLPFNLIVLSTPLLLTGCATPRAQLASGLRDAGLSQRLSDCMAGRMTDRLSLLQLRRIAGLPKAKSSESVEQFLYRIRALKDPQIVGVTTSSAALCASGFG